MTFFSKRGYTVCTLTIRELYGYMWIGPSTSGPTPTWMPLPRPSAARLRRGWEYTQTSQSSGKNNDQERGAAANRIRSR